eukprot:3952002-Amphidinium_carterae.1
MPASADQLTAIEVRFEDQLAAAVQAKKFDSTNSALQKRFQRSSAGSGSEAYKALKGLGLQALLA